MTVFFNFIVYNENMRINAKSSNALSYTIYLYKYIITVKEYNEWEKKFFPILLSQHL